MKRKLRNGQRVYLVSRIDRTIQLVTEDLVRKAIGIDPAISDIDLNWADGQIGACAVFTNKKKAKKYAGKPGEVMQLLLKNIPETPTGTEEKHANKTD